MADPNLTKSNPLDYLGGLLDLYNGKESTTTDSPTTTTSSTRSNMTDAQLQSIIGSAMAPVNAAQHTAGMYGSTPLAIARGQIAAETAAKNAGNTTTQTSSGGTRTTTTPGLADRLSSAAPGFLLTQFGAPALKKLMAGQNPLSSIADIFGAESVGPAAGALSPDILGSLGATDAFGTAADMSSLASNGMDSLLADGASFVPDVLGGIGDLFSSGGFEVGNFLDLGQFLKDGGLVKAAGKKPGYASGGFVDSKRAAISGDMGVDVNPQISASGAVDPNPQIPGLSGSTPAASTPTSQAQTLKQYADAQIAAHMDMSGSVGGAGGGPSNGTLGGAVSGFGGMALGMALGVGPSLGNVMGMGINAMNSQSGNSDGVAGPGESGWGMDLGQGDGSVGSAGPGDGGWGADLGMGDGGDGSGDMATGGDVRGPGTGTSDSVPANLSDGETVVTAKTTQLVKKHLGEDFFLKLEQAFNPAAAMAQVAKGRA